MVFHIFSYAYRTILAEISETSHVLKEVILFHSHDLIEGYQLKRAKKELQKKMKKAESFQEWLLYAEEFDKLKDMKAWKENIYSSHYDFEYIIILKNEFHEAREKQDHVLLIHLIRTHAVRGIGGISNPELFNICYLGTKNLIEDFHKEFILCLEFIFNLPPEKFPITNKLEFFAETRHAFGRTCLMLSGGAGLGLYHLGVLKTLFEERVIPRIITGSSVGSIIASAFATRPMNEADKIFAPGFLNFSAFAKENENCPMWRKLFRLFTEGYFMKSSVLAQFLRDNIGDVTFQEAYDKTGWILNITVTGSGPHDGYRVLNYLTAPNVLIWSAVVASCSIPIYFQPVELYCKNERNEEVVYVTGGRKFIDGSLGADLPRQKISEYFNVNNFLVSQTNPWVIPFMNSSENIRHTKKKYVLLFFETIKDFLLSELAHRAFQLSRIGLLPSSVKQSLNIFYQNYTGDITIWPIPKLMDYFNLLNIIHNPNDELIQYYIKNGKKRVYSKVAEIRSSIEIEKALERLYNELKHKQNKIKQPIVDTPSSPSIESNSQEENEESSPEKKPKQEVGRQSLFSMPRKSIFDVDHRMHTFLSQKSKESVKEEIPEEIER